MRNIFLIILCVSVSLLSEAQNPGYFGKKNVVEFSMNGQYPFFANLKFALNSTYMNKLDGDNLVSHRDRFDYGFRFAYMRTIKRNFGMGVEFGYDYFSVQRANWVDNNFFNETYHFEKTNVSSMMIMPKLEFSNKGGLLPMGIAHQIGFGFRMVKPTDKPTHYAVSQYNDYGYEVLGNATQLPAQYDYKGGAVKGFTFLYAVNMRTPLTKNLFLNYGLRYTLNFMGKASYAELNNGYNSSGMELSEPEFRNMVRQRKQVSFIQASLGLSFAL